MGTPSTASSAPVRLAPGQVLRFSGLKLRTRHLPATVQAVRGARAVVLYSVGGCLRHAVIDVDEQVRGVCSDEVLARTCLVTGDLDPILAALADGSAVIAARAPLDIDGEDTLSTTLPR